ASVASAAMDLARAVAISLVGCIASAGLARFLYCSARALADAAMAAPLGAASAAFSLARSAKLAAGALIAPDLIICSTIAPWASAWARDSLSASGFTFASPARRAS